MFSFDNTYVRLPARLYARVDPTPVASPRLVCCNEALARELGVDPERLASDEGVAILAGNRVPVGAEPLAQAYAGHQFGGLVPQLGDGRALLLGEVVDVHGRRRDVQLKGAGRTPFSRRGDGRAALGPVLREYLVSEAMHALGVPTTRALAAVTTGERVLRERPLPGAILTRVASSHLRVGTFQYAAIRRDAEGLAALVDDALARHEPAAADADNPPLALLRGVMDRQARLVAHWLGLGFIHGVMNTDNTSISGETIDYGPCAFMDAYDPGTVFSSIDHGGRYAYAAQPDIVGWNMARLAEALVPVIDADPDVAVGKARDALAPLPDLLRDAWLDVMRPKLGLPAARDDDAALIGALLDAMHAGGADYTNTFRALCDAAADPDADAQVRAEFSDAAAYDAWAARWRARLADGDESPVERRARMRGVNPAFIPRNHRVEAALAAAVDDGDFAPFDELRSVLATPYADQPGREAYRQPPAPAERVLQTFCGT